MGRNILVVLENKNIYLIYMDPVTFLIVTSPLISSIAGGIIGYIIGKHSREREEIHRFNELFDDLNPGQAGDL